MEDNISIGSKHSPRQNFDNNIPEITASPQVKRGEKKCFVKVVAIGDSGVGKTSLIQRFENCKFADNFKPTIGADFSNKEIVIDGKLIMLQIWDTAG